MKWPASSDSLAQAAFEGLFGRSPDGPMQLRYSHAFAPYGAHVTRARGALRFALSHLWREVSPEIQTGLLQHLLVKVFRHPGRTMEMDLYDRFVKALPKYTKSEEHDYELLEAYDRLNAQYFGADLNRPNLVWGGQSFRLLGHYNFLRHTITLSSVLRADPLLRDYVLYHEMLHQKHAFKKSGRRTHYHSKAFREDERQFHDPDAEKKLRALVRKERMRWW